MNVRDGFVSNSSSTSFTCDVTGEVLTGYDGEYDSAICTCSHCEAGFLASELYVPKKPTPEFMKLAIAAANHEYDEYDEDDNDEEIESPENPGELKKAFKLAVDKIKVGNRNTYIPKEMCPICTLDFIDDNELLRYLMLKTGVADVSEIYDEIRATFQDHDLLENFLKTMKSKKDKKDED
jgi:hypothetical protein